MHLLIATLFSVLLFPAAPALADGGGDITFQRMQALAADASRHR
ncbi:co-regulatory protein PtrA N-terminal domain-containing protein [Pseudomonas sp. NY15181]